MDFEISKSTNQMFLFLLEKISWEEKSLELIKASMSTSLQKNHVSEILGRVETEWSLHIFSAEMQYLRCVDN